MVDELNIRLNKDQTGEWTGRIRRRLAQKDLPAIATSVPPITK